MFYHDLNNPNYKLNAIWYNFERKELVGTDTRNLIIKDASQYEEELRELRENTLLIPAKIKKKSRYYNDTPEHIVKLDGVYFDCYSLEKWVDYVRLMPKAPNDIKNGITGIDCLYASTAAFGIVYDWEHYLPLYKKLPGFNRIHFVKKDEPVMFENETFKIIIMPVKIDDIYITKTPTVQKFEGKKDDVREPKESC